MTTTSAIPHSASQLVASSITDRAHQRPGLTPPARAARAPACQARAPRRTAPLVSLPLRVRHARDGPRAQAAGAGRAAAAKAAVRPEPCCGPRARGARRAGAHQLCSLPNLCARRLPAGARQPSSSPGAAPQRMRVPCEHAASSRPSHRLTWMCGARGPAGAPPASGARVVGGDARARQGAPLSRTDTFVSAAPGARVYAGGVSSRRPLRARTRARAWRAPWPRPVRGKVLRRPRARDTPRRIATCLLHTPSRTDRPHG